VPCAKFDVPGSQQLSNYAVKALKKHKACLLANHGIIVTGSGLEEALFLTQELEVLCKQITIAKINGTPKLVEKKKMKIIIEAVKTYGKQ
jgi:L-fuculose-phosphate aldolase